jgi:hypothetical protein
MEAYAALVHLSKVGEFIVDLYESEDGHVLLRIVDPTTDTVHHVVWLSAGLDGAAVLRCDSDRLVLRARCSERRG